MLVVGGGSIGSRHLANLLTLGEPRVALQRSGRGRPRPLHEKATTFTDLGAALRARPRAALICNPTSLHLESALAAARAGCHLFIEKPISHSLDGIEELRAEVTHQTLRVAVGFQYRFHPTLQQVKAWLIENAIGEVATVRAHWGEYLPNWHPDEDYQDGYSARRDLGGGVVLTLCHPFDYLRWLIGEIEVVLGATGCCSGLELDVEDVAHAVLRFSSGAIGHVSLDYLEQPRTHRVEIIGRRGRIRWRERDGRAELRDREGVGQSVLPPHRFSRNDMFLDEVSHFIDCVAARAEPACGLDDGVRALEVALAVKRSWEERHAIDL
jgi:predicted dehydrogenase